MALSRQKTTVGTIAERPAYNAVPVGTLYRTTDVGAEYTYRSTGSAWVIESYGGGGAWPGFSDAEGDPAALGTAADGTSTYPARRDHVHPSSHAHAPGDVTGTAVVTNDSRLTDARTPTTHDSTKHSVTYEVASSKGAANGYASLDANTLVPAAQLATGTPTGAKYLRDDRTWQAVVAGGAPTGREPYVLPISFAPNAAFTTYLALAANGGTLCVPFQINAPFSLVSVSVRNGDAATARTWGWDLYKDTGAAALTRVAACTANESFTPSAVSTRTVAASGGPIALDPGTYWLAIQSRHATSTFAVGSTAASSAFNLNTGQTKTNSNPNGASLDFVAATWTKVTAMYAARLNGAVFGQSTSF